MLKKPEEFLHYTIVIEAITSLTRTFYIKMSLDPNFFAELLKVYFTLL